MKELKELESIEEVDTETLKNILESIDYLSAKDIGFYDKSTAHRYYLYDCFETDSSLNIRSPSRNWPYSVLKHTGTKKYQKQLKEKIEKELERRLIK